MRLPLTKDNPLAPIPHPDKSFVIKASLQSTKSLWKFAQAKDALLFRSFVIGMATYTDHMSISNSSFVIGITTYTDHTDTILSHKEMLS